MTKLMSKLLHALTLLLVTQTIANAASPAQWDIVPKDSSIIFTATQNGAPVTGQFNNFVGEVNFDPAALDSSKIEINVDITSLSTSYKDIENTLKTPEWLDSKLLNLPKQATTLIKQTEH
jgi:polyisoprenoid-binding protein YceI